VSRAAAREYAVRLAAGGSLLLLALRGRVAAALVSGGVVVGALAGVTLYAAGRAGVISFP